MDPRALAELFPDWKERGAPLHQSVTGDELLVLATNREPVAQLVALLYMENALALFESLMPEPWPLPVHVAVRGVYVGTVVVGSWLIRSRHSSSLLAAQSREDGR